MSCANLADDCLQASLSLHRCHLLVKSPNFLGLHAFYGDAYEALDGWYDRFAERALAEGEKLLPVDTTIPEPAGDCITYATKVIATLDAACEDGHGEDNIADAMIDELREYLGKLRWQLKAMG